MATVTGPRRPSDEDDRVDDDRPTLPELEDGHWMHRATEFAHVKAVKPGWAAKVLGVDQADLPKLDRPWTKRDVRALREDRPSWLTEARRRHATRVQQQSEARVVRLDAVMARLGYNDPDLGTVDQAVLYIDGAVTHLMIETGCCERDADAVARRRWPKSMAAEEEYGDAGAGW